jgi:hypothetical protein
MKNMANPNIVLEWAFSPADYFEEPSEIHRDNYTMTIANGKVEARVESPVYDKDPSLRQALHDALTGLFLGVQLLVHKPFTLSGPTVIRLNPDGQRDIQVELDPIGIKLGISMEIQVLDKDGKVLRDSRRERIEKKKSLAARVENLRAKDPLLAALLQSYDKAVRDPDNELVHLYEIRDALSKRFGEGNAARLALGISSGAWTRLGKLANDEPLRQGRHRGKSAGTLRDATDSELVEVRNIARSMIESYLLYLEATMPPGSQ